MAEDIINNLRIDTNEKEIPQIIGYRRANPDDISRICQMVRKTTCDLFGDVEVGQVIERACLSLVQINEQQEIVSNVSLCNFPNISSVPANDWLSWLAMHYGIPNVYERNALFIHLLVWDTRYSEIFFKILLNDVFAITSYCLHVLMIVPPGVESDTVEIFSSHMEKCDLRNEIDTENYQQIYISLRHREDPKLRIRRVVEEDNDDLIPIIEADSKRLKQLYGDYYISEIIRDSNNNGNRQLIVAEKNGTAAGVMCLNRQFDLAILIENFELSPYDDLRKVSRRNSSISGMISSAVSTISSEIERTTSEFGIDEGDSKNRERFSHAVTQTLRFADEIENEYGENESEDPLSPISGSAVSSDRPSESSGRSVDFESVLRTSVFADAINELPMTSLASSIHADDPELLQIDQKAQRRSSSEAAPGELNAFALELFSIHEKIDERHGRDYLEAAFECFPDLDYCLLLLPSTEPFFTFLENFVRVPLRFYKDFPMVLYVTHRATLLGSLRSRQAIPYDREEIIEFLRGISKKKVIIEDFEESMAYSNNKRDNKSCYVFLCEDKIVGLAVLCPESNIDELCINYDIEKFVSMKNTRRDDHAELLHFLLVPIFSVYHRLFYRELMRLSSTTVLYYRLYENDTTALNRTRPLISCLDTMIVVPSRTRIHRPYQNFDEKLGEPNFEKFSLFLSTPRIAMLSKPVINTKILVIGGSDCGVAFAEYLAFQNYCANVQHFTNLTIVSPNGIPFEGKVTSEHATMIPFKGRYCYDYRKVVPSKVWINVVHGILVYINRKEKYVTISGHGTLSYDYLVLTCGLPYQVPTFSDNKSPEKRFAQKIPLNCFCINDNVDAATCLHRLRELTNNFTSKKFIVIYGRNIESLCALNCLLEAGVKGSWIVLIEPKLPDCEKSSDIFFGNNGIKEIVENFIRQSGVKIISEWDLKDWILETGETLSDNETEQTYMLKSLKIGSKMEKKIIPCDALLYFGDKMMPIKTFMAISRAGLVFDGRLVIDPDYRTNDPHIFAAGSITKYSRKFRAESWQHQYYNSVEVGEELAKRLKSIIDCEGKPSDKNFRPENSKLNTDNARPNLPIFSTPIVVYCRLPGGLHYLHVRKPGKQVSGADEIAQGSSSNVLTTGSTLDVSTVGYFRIQFDSFNRIETITCLRKQDFRMQDFITLYGKHETMLNNIRLRYDNSLISDLFAYFGEPWAAALFHDRFDRLRAANRAALESQARIEGCSLMQDALTACIESGWSEPKKEYRQAIESNYEGSAYQAAISSNVINFLQSEEAILPMYCNQRKLRRQLMENDDTQLPEQ